MSDRLAVMAQGLIEQVGTPTEVYTEPMSAYVADFLGVSNLLDVDVLDADGPDAVAVRFGELTLRCSAPSGHEKGPAKAVLRPERIGLLPSGETGPNRVPGMVERCVFLGSTTQVYVRLAPGASVQALVPNSDGIAGVGAGCPRQRAPARRRAAPAAGLSPGAAVPRAFSSHANPSSRATSCIVTLVARSRADRRVAEDHLDREPVEQRREHQREVVDVDGVELAAVDAGADDLGDLVPPALVQLLAVAGTPRGGARPAPTGPARAARTTRGCRCRPAARSSSATSASTLAWAPSMASAAGGLRVEQVLGVAQRVGEQAVLGAEVVDDQRAGWRRPGGRCR